jgi:glycosyltransferase involved in cell wall biosynthesis
MPSFSLNTGLKQRIKQAVLPSMGRLHIHPPRAIRLPAYDEKYVGVQAWPKISVVIPSFNQGEFIGETLQSLLEEAYPNLEMIVIDGGSNDASVDVIRSFESQLSYWISEPDGGQTQAINKGFARSTGQIMAWLNADDRIVPGSLHKIAHYFTSQPEIDVLYGNRILIDAEGGEIGRWILPRHSSNILKWFDFVPQETLYWRRSAWEAVGAQLDENFSFAMDWDLLTRFLAKKQKMVHLPLCLGLFRVHPQQKTQFQMSSVGCAEIKKIRLRELGFVPRKRWLALRVIPYFLAARFTEIVQGRR